MFGSYLLAKSTSTHSKIASDLVGGTGIEPVASSVSGKRSPAELTAHRGGSGNRTRVQGFAGPCLSHSAIPPQADPFESGRCRRAELTVSSRDGFRHLGADDGIRTRDPHLGKVMLYQLSHVRLLPGRAGQASRTGVRSETVADPDGRANSHTRIGRPARGCQPPVGALASEPCRYG